MQSIKIENKNIVIYIEKKKTCPSEHYQLQCTIISAAL